MGVYLRVIATFTDERMGLSLTEAPSLGPQTRCLWL